MNYRIDLTVLSESERGCLMGLTVHNLSDQRISSWSLEFLFDRYIEPKSLTTGDIQQVGSDCLLTPNMTPLEANGHFYCEFLIQSMPIRFHSDGIKQAMLVVDNHLRYPVDVTPIALAQQNADSSSLPHPPVSAIAIIPKPQQLQALSGQFLLSSNTCLLCHSSLAADAQQWLEQEMAELYAIEFGQQPTPTNHVELKFNPTLNAQGYRLNVQSHCVLLEASSERGFVYGVASLLQLLTTPDEKTKCGYLPCVLIVDKPRFTYRGMMLDCARHFHSISSIKKLINQLAYYKLNTLHWHLTDDEGWRIEIRAFPQLTKIGAKRGHGTQLEPQFSHLDSVYGEFYTQTQIQEVIEYAAIRGITIIPEIDIPGHCRAAIKSLPELLFNPNDHSQYKSVQHYRDNVLSPALAGTYTFLDTVLEEVCALFPSPWLHIGADEVPEGAWSDCPLCAELMKDHGYEQPNQLQGHLLSYVESKLKKLGKRMVGWEEAQHGNKVSKDTVIYSWLSEQAALNCAKQGFDVILQPGQYTYLDMCQDFSPQEPGVSWANVLPLETTYRYEPLAQLATSDPIRKRILGIQCALWSEIVTTPQRLEYMVYPRLSAVAEVGWSQPTQREWHDYLSRLPAHLKRWDKQGVGYRNPWKTSI